MEDLEPDLLQLRYRYEPWKLLVVCILLNRTSRRQVEPMIDTFFADYPTPDALAHARESDLWEHLRSLGMYRTRAQRLRAFAEDWLALEFMWEGTTPTGLTELSALTGVGEYALDTYRMIVLNDLSVRPLDRKLSRWLEWRLHQGE